MSPPTNSEWSALSKCVQSMIQRADTEPFRDPVDWKGLGIVDYPQVIKKPMDLGTVKKGIADRKYKTLSDAAHDVRLVWTNCMTYNADGSDFYLLAKNLSKKWEDKFSKLLKDLKVEEDAAAEAAASTSASATAAATSTASSSNAAANSGDGSNQVSLDDKRTFARSLYKVSKEDLGKIIVEVDNKCPAAISRNTAEDELELNVDKITPNLFQELKVFISNCGKITSGKKKAPSSSKSSSGSKRQKT